MYVLRLRFRQNGYGFDAAVEGLQLFLPPEKQWSKSKRDSFSVSPFFSRQTPKRREFKDGQTFFPPLMMSGRTFSGFSRQNIATSSKNQLTTSKMSH